IQKGKVRVSKSMTGRPHVMAILEKGDFFGEMALVNRIKRTATVTAIYSVELLAFDRRHLPREIDCLFILFHLCGHDSFSQLFFEIILLYFFTRICQFFLQGAGFSRSP
ncbi:MAG: cyclic nucleotide-binding domain-containing protein, partial [Thermodesulfobacteriota bacterium]